MTPLEQAREALEAATYDKSFGCLKERNQAAIRAAPASLEAATQQPAALPESMSRDEMLSYYSEYANMVAHEVVGYQKRIRDLEAALATPAEGGGVEPPCRAEQRGPDSWSCDCFHMRPDCKPNLASPSVPAEGGWRDAERYRWLRSQFVSENVNSIDPPYWRTDLRCDLEGETFDEAVDAAMQSTNGGKP